MTPIANQSMPRLAFALTLAGVLAGCGFAAPPAASTPVRANPTLTSAATSKAPAAVAVSPVRSSPAVRPLPPELPPASSGSSFHIATDADMAAAARASQASQQALESSLK